MGATDYSKPTTEGESVRWPRSVVYLAEIVSALKSVPLLVALMMLIWSSTTPLNSSGFGGPKGSETYPYIMGALALMLLLFLQVWSVDRESKGLLILTSLLLSLCDLAWFVPFIWSGGLVEGLIVILFAGFIPALQITVFFRALNLPWEDQVLPRDDRIETLP
jgi:hypothetical protein